MNNIILALGSNVGNSEKNIVDAVDLLSEHISKIKCAKIYRSHAVGFEDQADFFNTAIIGETSLAPEQLLDFTQDVEKRIGRVFRFHWGPREIDIDIIFFDDLVYKSSGLQIPHPRANERDFVLKPAADIAPNFIHPELGKSIRQLYEALDKSKLSIIE
jgi:2-amino-4-hydroxy-6-hydroxymethyldihydropteridine diphosphokinase